MYHRKMQRVFSVILLAGMFLSFLAPGGVRATPASTEAENTSTTASIEALVIREIDADGQTDFFVWLKEKADLSPAKDLKTKLEKGTFVFNALRETAARTQQDLRTYLDSQGISYKAFYIANKILV